MSAAAKQGVQAAMSLRRSSHRQVVSADGGLVCEVFSGALGIEGADRMEELIVRACNRDHLFDELVEALRMIAGGHGCPSALAADALAKVSA